MKNYYEKFKNHYIALKNQEIISYCRIFEYAIVKYYRIKKIYNLVDSLEKASHNWFELKRENKNKKMIFYIEQIYV